ncbi:MAG: alanine/glycine:cation symporter family protein, partial [Oscillospiraceae bacterium]|nr:alanine/glycine:cation symporter family protein [Oscillospiraceae bacterium]
IVGVATALVSGGPGAIFWMWVSAFFGMLTNYAENVLGILFRYRNEKNDWLGGPMIYIERGMHCKWLAVLFACFTVLASFGIGNMTQANGIASAINTVSGIPAWVTGITLTLLVALVIIGGIKRIAAVTEKIVPVMALVYIVGGITLLAMNYQHIPAAFGEIFAGAFNLKSVGGGVGGYVIMKAIRFGVARGVFSNEAGLGSSVMVHSASNVKEPVKQGMWGIFEVFADTLIVCTLTALCILTTGVLDTGAKGAQLAMAAFSHGFGGFGGTFVSIAIAFFAFSTILGWSYYGERAVEYLIGVKNLIYYKIIFICLITVGCVASLELVWDISDTFNSLMAIPNLIGVLSLSGFVIAATKDFLSRKPSCPEEEKNITAEDLLAQHPDLSKHFFSKKEKSHTNK